jgi:hypothetical protein
MSDVKTYQIASIDTADPQIKIVLSFEVTIVPNSSLIQRIFLSLTTVFSFYIQHYNVKELGLGFFQKSYKKAR